MKTLRNTVLTLFWAVCCSVSAATVQVGVLDLTEDTEIIVAAGSRVEIAHVNVEVGGLLALGGTLKAQSVKASEIAPLSPDAAVAGTLDLTGACDVKVDSSLYGDALDEGYVRILAATSVTGRTGTWRVESSTGRTLRLRVKSDGIYATGKIPGLQVIIR